jgi:hypothetical protein
MSNVQTNPTKTASRIDVAPAVSTPETDKKQSIVLAQTEEVKPLKSVIEITKSVNTLNSLLSQHTNFQSRLEEIGNFKSLISDGSGCNCVITHSSGVSITFTNLDFIHKAINDAYENGGNAMKELEQKIINSPI